MILMKNRVEEILKPGVIVAHYKREEYLTGEDVDPNMYLYQVCGIATNTETNGHMVIYQALYGDHEIFVRPLEEFIGTCVKTTVGIKHNKYFIPRFSIHTDPVDVAPGVQAAGIVAKESEEIKKLRKKVKRLQNDLKKARKESEGSLKKPAPKKAAKNIDVTMPNVVAGDVYADVNVPVVHTGTSAIDPKINDAVKSTNISSMEEYYQAIATTIKPSEDEAVSESEEAEESARFLANKKESK